MTGAGQPALTGETGPPAVVELFGRPGCCLCDDARDVLERLRDELSFELVELDITADEPVHRAYFERIPVIRLNGEELFDFHVDEAVLRRALARVGDDLESLR
jgi:glutaredoxin